MSMQHLLQDQVVRADPWTLFCAECSQKMRVMTATPAQEGRERRTYECVCGHSERINVAIHRRTLEEAKAQFQKSWDAWKAWAKLEEVP
jgi:hypothetical protein